MFVLPHMCSDYNGNVVYYVHDAREASKIVVLVVAHLAFLLPPIYAEAKIQFLSVEKKC